MTPVARLAQARAAFHADLLGSVLTVTDDGTASTADKDSRLSRALALDVADRIGGARVMVKGAGQTAGTAFETLCAAFIATGFGALSHLRPGQFDVLKGGAIDAFDQYAHLSALDAIARANRDVAVALGSDYLIKPDIVIRRQPLTEAALNALGLVADDAVARLTPARALNWALPSLHASISCKWTLRSDRAQNARSEALNLIRNRKGRAPHIAVVTGEPLPSRIASLALGTGDIDCVYHFALPELQAAVQSQGSPEAREAMAAMVEGRRLRDIADLPLDLII
jgi:hypothetical protein